MARNAWQMSKCRNEVCHSHKGHLLYREWGRMRMRVWFVTSYKQLSPTSQMVFGSVVSTFVFFYFHWGNSVLGNYFFKIVFGLGGERTFSYQGKVKVMGETHLEFTGSQAQLSNYKIKSNLPLLPQTQQLFNDPLPCTLSLVSNIYPIHHQRMQLSKVKKPANDQKFSRECESPDGRQRERERRAKMYPVLWNLTFRFLPFRPSPPLITLATQVCQ